MQSVTKTEGYMSKISQRNIKCPALRTLPVGKSKVNVKAETLQDYFVCVTIPKEQAVDGDKDIRNNYHLISMNTCV